MAGEVVLIDPATGDSYRAGGGGGTGASAQQVQGTTASGSTATTNPVLIAMNGGGFVQPLIGTSINADNLTPGPANNSLSTKAFSYFFDGTQFQRTRGDLRGAWTHLPPSAVDTTQSGTIATSGGTASVTFDNAARLEVINPSTGNLWARWNAAPAVNGAGSFPIAVGGSYAPGFGTAGTLQLLSTAAGQPFTVNRLG